MGEQIQKIVEAQHEIIATKSQNEQLLKNTHPDAQWFLKGKNLGLFIHWGIAAADGNAEISWSMFAGKPWDREGYKNTVTPAYYFGLAEKFAPNGCDFDKIIKAAAECGYTYAVLTTRHHEGFALWPSNYGDFNTKKYHGGKDFVQDYVNACRKYGLKVGLYYSPPDWYRNQKYMSFNYQSRTPEFPNKPHFDIYHQHIEKLPEKPEGWDLQEAQYVAGQVRELLTRYGKIDILWFDGSIPRADMSITIQEIRELQPSIIVNKRMHGKGDFLEHELSFPDGPLGCPWEYCTTWTEFDWGYSEECLATHRSARWGADLFKTVCEWNGNLLLNVGPDNNGEVPEITYKTMYEMKKILEKEKIL